jgi:AraC-like DNA-binding protein
MGIAAEQRLALRLFIILKLLKNHAQEHPFNMKRSIKITGVDLGKYEQVKQLILEDITRHYTIAELSARSAMKESKLKTGFKLIYGESIYGFLKNQRLKRAIHLLSNSEDSIQEIAAKCGFAHATNFIAVFQKRFKIKPTHYRKSHAIHKVLLSRNTKPCFTNKAIPSSYQQLELCIDGLISPLPPLRGTM